MKPGAVISIPDAVAQTKGGRVSAIQPGLPGRWSVWSQAAGAPGSHFVIPFDEEARATGVKYATVRITAPAQSVKPVIKLDACDPSGAMPKIVKPR